jgi:uncharacterized protein YbaR (Trm112 family)
MISADLLKMLQCPDDRTPVREAEAGLVAELNAAARVGKLRNRAGEAVTETMDGGLVRQDGKFLYPIRDGIPVMLIDEAIPVPPRGDNGATGG